MDKKLKAGGAKTSATDLKGSQKVKPDISYEPRMLTPSEENLLRQDLQQTVEIARKVKAKLG
jgi:hypothetical protein